MYSSLTSSLFFGAAYRAASEAVSAYLFSSLIIWLSAGPSTPLGVFSDTEVALGGFSPAGIAEPSLEAFAVVSTFAFLLFADLDSPAIAPAAEAIMLEQRW